MVCSNTLLVDYCSWYLGQFHVQASRSQNIESRPDQSWPLSNIQTLPKNHQGLYHRSWHWIKMGRSYFDLVEDISLFFLKFQTKDEKYHRIIDQQIKTSNDTQDTLAQHSNGLRNPGFEMSEKI